MVKYISYIMKLSVSVLIYIHNGTPTIDLERGFTPLPAPLTPEFRFNGAFFPAGASLKELSLCFSGLQDWLIFMLSPISWHWEWIALTCKEYQHWTLWARWPPGLSLSPDLSKYLQTFVSGGRHYHNWDLCSHQRLTPLRHHQLQPPNKQILCL